MSNQGTQQGAIVLVLFLIVALWAHFEVQAAREQEAQETTVQVEAHRWMNLSEEEWQRYQFRRQVMGRPLIEMTPYEVLGLYADDPEQQRRYARENARFMLDFYRRTMAFEEVYREEMRKLTQASLHFPSE